MWIERRVRRTVQQAASRLQPDALALEIGRSARQMAESTSERVRSAVSVGRTEMQQHEEELWAELAERRATPDRATLPEADGWLTGSTPEPGASAPVRRRPRVGVAKSASHLGN